MPIVSSEQADRPQTRRSGSYFLADPPDVDEGIYLRFDEYTVNIAVVTDGAAARHRRCAGCRNGLARYRRHAWRGNVCRLWVAR